jgi:hypothetical protein
MDERRKAARQKSLLRGRVRCNDGRSTADCVIRDIAPDGARLIFSDAINVPDVMEIEIPQKGQTVRAHARWRRGPEIGVTFIRPGAAGEPADRDLAARVEQLEAEVAELRRALKRLKTDSPNFDAA